MRALSLVAAVLLLWPSGRASAQVVDGSGAALDSAEAALDAGRLDRARSLLERWESAGGEASPAGRNRARFLRARLTADADSAESLYLSLALEGDAGYGDRAWLRLAQLHLARGEPARARAELERLRADYPSSELAGGSWYWTGLAAAGAGDGAGACRAWRRAAEAGGEPGELAEEALSRCRGDGSLAAAPGDSARDSGADAAEPEAAGPPAGVGPPEAGFAVQLGAFREESRARDLAERARSAGFEVRTLPPSPRDGLIRVRTRTVRERSAAARLVRRLEGAGLPAMVVELDGSPPDGSRRNESPREVER